MPGMKDLPNRALAGIGSFLEPAEHSALQQTTRVPLPRTRPRSNQLVTGAVIEVEGLKIGCISDPVFDSAAVYYPLPANRSFLAAHIDVRCKRGWKLHISAYPYNAQEIANVVLPILCKMRIGHKYVQSSMLLSRMTGEQRGKFITIYTNDNSEAGEGDQIASIKATVCPLLQHFAGPEIVDGEGAPERKFGHLIYGRLSSDYRRPGA